jgi:hypothetical protein
LEAAEADGGHLVPVRVLHHQNPHPITSKTTEKSRHRKLSFLELPGELNNLPKSFQLMGYSRQQ